MNWQIRYTEKAKKDLKKLNNSVKAEIIKKISRVAKNPLPQNEGGYGKPLGNNSKTKLAGFLKIKFLKSGIRVVYKLIKTEETMKIIVISVRDDDFCYQEAQEREKEEI